MKYKWPNSDFLHDSTVFPGVKEKVTVEEHIAVAQVERYPGGAS